MSTLKKEQLQTAISKLKAEIADLRLEKTHFYEMLKDQDQSEEVKSEIKVMIAEIENDIGESEADLRMLQGKVQSLNSDIKSDEIVTASAVDFEQQNFVDEDQPDHTTNEPIH